MGHRTEVEKSLVERVQCRPQVRARTAWATVERKRFFRFAPAQLLDEASEMTVSGAIAKAVRPVRRPGCSNHCEDRIYAVNVSVRSERRIIDKPLARKMGVEAPMVGAIYCHGYAG